MSDKDFNGLLLTPVITLPLLPLSNSASTDSCNILFSFRIIMSGALNSISLFRRLFLFITLLYRSFRSEVANLPPSCGTNGLSSGGITGITSSIIHSGLAPDSIKDSTSLSLLTNFFLLISEPVLMRSSRILIISSSRSISINIFFIASAPMATSKLSSPNSSRALS